MSKSTRGFRYRPTLTALISAFLAGLQLVSTADFAGVIGVLPAGVA